MSKIRKVVFGLSFSMMCVGLASFDGANAQNARANTSVNMRAGPGTNYSVITTIPQGAYVRILGCTAGYAWCGVEYTGIEGYAAGRYLTVTSGQYAGQLLTGVGVGLALGIPRWRYDYWRPPHYRPPNHRPPGYRPPGYRPPGGRPPGFRPPGGRPPGFRPPGGRPPGFRPPGGRPPGMRPPGNRPPGMRPPGNRPGKPSRPPRRNRR